MAMCSMWYLAWFIAIDGGVAIAGPHRGTQAFMTGTDASVFAPLGETAQRLVVTDGTVRDAGGDGP